MKKRGVCFYDPAITRELVDLQKERLDREEISIHYYKRVKIGGKTALDEFYLTRNPAFKYAKAWDKVSHLGGPRKAHRPFPGSQRLWPQYQGRCGVGSPQIPALL